MANFCSYGSIHCMYPPRYLKHPTSFRFSPFRFQLTCLPPLLKLITLLLATFYLFSAFSIHTYSPNSETSFCSFSYESSTITVSSANSNWPTFQHPTIASQSRTPYIHFLHLFIFIQINPFLYFFVQVMLPISFSNADLKFVLIDKAKQNFFECWMF